MRSPQIRALRRYRVGVTVSIGVELDIYAPDETEAQAQAEGVLASLAHEGAAMAERQGARALGAHPMSFCLTEENNDD